MPLHFLFCSLNNPVSISPCTSGSNALIIFTVLCRTHSSMSMSFLPCGAQTWIEHSSHGFTRAESEGEDHLPQLAGATTYCSPPGHLHIRVHFWVVIFVVFQVLFGSAITQPVTPQAVQVWGDLAGGRQKFCPQGFLPLSRASQMLSHCPPLSPLRQTDQPVI